MNFIKRLKKLKTGTDNLQASLIDNDLFIYFLLVLTILFVFIARLHLLSFPFERDEGEYAYMGKLILDGHPPYTLAYNMKLPGTYFMYAFMMAIFGKSIVGVHLGVTFMILASMLLVFLITKKIVSKTGAVIATATYGILGTSWTLLAQAAHATHFVVFFTLVGTYILLQLYDNNKNSLLKYFLAGFFFSLAFICKQSGVFFTLFGATIIIVNEYKDTRLKKLIKNLILYSSGFAVPILLMLLYFYLFGDFNKFWFWTVRYLSKYSAQVPLSQALPMLKKGITSITADFKPVGYTALWILSLIGIPFILFRKNTHQNKIILLSFYLFAFLTVVPGFYFRRHYFITLLPVTGMTLAVFFDYFNDLFINKLKKPWLVYITLLLFIVITGSGVLANKDYLFRRDPKISCKQVYGSNPFVESPEIAEFIRQNTTENDKIAVLGSEPQIYFYADRYPATGYIYMYNLMELHSYALSMQKEMIREIETNQPAYIIFVNVGMSWLPRPDSEKFILKWANGFIGKNYKLAGFMDVFPDRVSSLKVGEALNKYKPQSNEIIYIYKRN